MPEAIKAMRVDITYVNQAIPSRYGMPASAIKLEENSFFEPTADVSGERVNAYMDLVLAAHEACIMRKLIPASAEKGFKFQQQDNSDSICLLNLARFQPLRARNGFFKNCKDFQQSAVHIWRLDVPRASAILPPALCEDQTSNRGSAKAVLSLLQLYEIIEVTASSGVDGDIKELKLAENHKKRYLMTVGDGLTQMRLAASRMMIESSAFTFVARQKAAELLNAALGQVINIIGDLHGGGFHFLGCVYNLYYAVLIQPFQTALGWKRICGSDVTKCYQQAAALALLLLDEGKRILYGEFSRQLLNNEEDCEEFQGIADPEESAVWFIRKFHSWIDERLLLTTDEDFFALLQFAKLMRRYRLFRVSVRNGDTISIEWLYRRNRPVFYSLRKTNYYEIGLSAMEEQYGMIPFDILQLCRVNRTIPLYSGVDKRTNEPMTNWALDGVIELM
jgi:hypothetical protein